MPYAKAACLKPLVARRASAIGPDMTLPTPIVKSNIDMIVGGDDTSFFAITVIILGHNDGNLAVRVQLQVLLYVEDELCLPQAEEAKNDCVSYENAYIPAESP